MKKNKKIVGTVILCSCLTLVAIGAGTAFQLGEQAPLVQKFETNAKGTQIIEVEPVTVSKTPTIEETVMEENQGELEQFDSAEKKVEPNDVDSVSPQKEESKKGTSEVASQESLQFSYPVVGEVILPYSVETAIYDPTLDQYRTNDTMSIGSKEGTAVKAAEKGKVKEVLKDEESGNSLVVEHSDGWVTTYSQLAQDMSVAVGDSVEKGQTIATIAQPTKYTVALGEHFEFSMKKDGESKNPEETIKE